MRWCSTWSNLHWLSVCPKRAQSSIPIRVRGTNSKSLKHVSGTGVLHCLYFTYLKWNWSVWAGEIPNSDVAVPQRPIFFHWGSRWLAEIWISVSLPSLSSMSQCIFSVGAFPLLIPYELAILSTNIKSNLLPVLRIVIIIWLPTSKKINKYKRETDCAIWLHKKK